MKKRVARMGLTALALLALLCGFGCRKAEEKATDWRDAWCGKVRALTVAANGEKPTAWDFLTEEGQAACREKKITVSFTSEPDFTALGETQVVLSLQRGKKSETAVTACSVVEDTDGPVIEGVRDYAVACGEGVALRAGIKMTDNCFGRLRLEIDDTLLNTEQEGTYFVTYRAKDASGNETVEISRVTVYPMQITEDMLWARVDELLPKLFGKMATKEERCRAIYDSVQASLYYEPRSEQKDWISAAYLALFVEGKGDCYSYMCATKALLFRAGVESLTIQRLPGYTEDTHFWLMVCLDSGEWYHLDPTELAADDYTHSGCLLTDAQIAAYNRVRPHFYEYDVSAYPTSGVRILTPTPKLDGV